MKPGSEVDLDSLIKDTIRLTASAEVACIAPNPLSKALQYSGYTNTNIYFQDTCSESCAKSAVVWQCTQEIYLSTIIISPLNHENGFRTNFCICLQIRIETGASIKGGRGC